jgi:hypothetical protein
VLKLDSGGAIEWQKIYWGTEDDRLSSIRQNAADGGYVVAGETKSFGAGQNDILVLKLDGTGAVEWQKTFGGAEDDFANVVMNTADGGYLVAGETESSGAGHEDMLLIKLDAGGNIEWQKTYGGNNMDVINSVLQTPDGDYVVAGHTSSFGDGAKDICILTLNNEGQIPNCNNNMIGTSTFTVNDAAVSSLDTLVQASSGPTLAQKTEGEVRDSTELMPVDICEVQVTTTTTVPPETTTTTVPDTISNSKAIIVAGGGPYPTNNLWEATQVVANYAYRTFRYQGFSADDIHYLTFDEQVDIEPDGLVDYDGKPTIENLENAITVWAADADEVIIYLSDHGGEGTFRMSETEVLFATQLDKWIDDLQAIIAGKVVFIYDACESGSFLPLLTPPTGKQRILITSASAGEAAFFMTEGTVSFSHFFWSNVYNGLNLYESFVTAKNAMGTAEYQNALLDDNGNGIGNEEEDGLFAREYLIGSGKITAADIPNIGTISDDQVLNGETSATITVGDITSSSTIVMVWALIRGPGSASDDPSVPVTNLPSIVLTKIGTNQYKGEYTGFTEAGSYYISVHAMDDKTNISLPKMTKVTRMEGSCPAALLLPENDPRLTLIRRFRTEVLAESTIGKKLIQFYYKNAKTVTGIFDRYPVTKKIAQRMLELSVPVMEKYLD